MRSMVGSPLRNGYLALRIFTLLFTVMAGVSFPGPAFSGQVDSSPSSAPTQLRLVDVTDIDLAGFLRTTTDIANVNLVAMAPAGARASVRFGFSTPSELLEKLAGSTGLRLFIQDKHIAIIHPGCLRSASNTIGVPLTGDKVSLNFQELPLGALMELLELHLDLDDAATNAYASQSLSLRIRDQPRDALLRAAAMAVGVDMIANKSGKIQLVRATTSSCKVPDMAHPFDLDSYRRRMMRRSSNCPYIAPKNVRQKDGKPIRCEELEYYGLRTLLPRGYLQKEGRFFAYVESSSNGLIYSVQAGDYMGRSFGKVLKVSADGIDLREIFQDADGVWQEWPTMLAYGGRYMPRELNRNNYYIQEDSPQSDYNKAVNVLFVFRNSVLNTQQICKQYVPKSLPAINVAISGWEARNARLLQLIDKHATAYGERTAEDYVVQMKDVLANAHQNAKRYLHEYLSIMGGPDSASVQQYCNEFSSLLQSDALKFEVRFPRELSLLEGCQKASTCPNL